MTNQLVEVSFRNQAIQTIEQNGSVFIAMRPVCENIGLDWTRQSKKLASQSDRFNCRHMSTVARDGKNRKTLCIPLRKLNGWLFSVNPEKVNPEIKDTLIAYQEECFEVLYSHFHNRHEIASAPLVVRTERCNYPALNELLERPRSFVSEFNGMAYVDSKALVRVYGVLARDLNAIVRRLEVTQDFAERNIVKCKGAGYQFTLWGFLLLSRHIEGDLSSEVTLAFIRALMANTATTAGSDLDTPLLVDSDYRRRARDYAADMFQRWYRQATAAGISVDDFNRADIDKFADGLLADALTRFRVEIGFNQHLEAKVSFLPQDVIQLAPSSRESMSNLVQNVVDTDVLQEMLMAGVARLGRAAK